MHRSSKLLRPLQACGGHAVIALLMVLVREPRQVSEFPGLQSIAQLEALLAFLLVTLFDLEFRLFSQRVPIAVALSEFELWLCSRCLFHGRGCLLKSFWISTLKFMTFPAKADVTIMSSSLRFVSA